MTADTAAGGHPSAAFERLHPRLQRWVWEHRWTELRDAQEAAVEPILAGDTDVIIAAATASGKTEAAFLPICSALVESPMTLGPGVQVLYVSPLKALINDQFDRLDQLCEHLQIPVHRWHGDVAGSRKARLLRDPDGVLLITPESLEAIFAVHGARVPRLLGGLRYVVVDELHSFLGTERGGAATVAAAPGRARAPAARIADRALGNTRGDAASGGVPAPRSGQRGAAHHLHGRLAGAETPTTRLRRRPATARRPGSGGGTRGGSGGYARGRGRGRQARDQ